MKISLEPITNLKVVKSACHYVLSGAIIRDGDRKRGVHASPCVVPKKLFLEKIAPPSTSLTRADTRKFAWGYYLIWKVEEKFQFGFDKII